MVKVVLESKSFAVVGASRENYKVGNVIFKNLIERGIKAFPVNPNTDEILGKKCYKNIKDISEKVDCAIIAVKSEIVPAALNDAAEKGIKNAVVISAGFSEAGNFKLEEDIKKICEKNSIKLIGPNTLGIINTLTNVNASFFEHMPRQGKIAFLSQSGAIGTAVLDMNIGFSGFISLGNMALTDFSELIDYFSNDRNTEVITLYIESLKKGKGREFIEACKRCKKPIVALKAGKTPVGKKAASSHTAALASEEGVYEGIFKQCRIIEADSIKQMFQIADFIVKLKAVGKNACVISNAGGLGVLCSDYCYKNGINIPELGENIIEKLNNLLPPGWSKNNPVDILGDAKAELYEKTFHVLENYKTFDFFIMLLTPQYMTEPEKTAEAVLKIKEKPVLACFMGEKSIEKAREMLSEKIPVFSEVKEMCEVLGKVAS